MLKSLGRFEKALPLYERVLAGDERAHGADHPHTMDSVYNLARLYDATNELDKAVPLFRRELAGCSAHYGRNHGETKTSASNLVTVLKKMGDEEGALALIEEYELISPEAPAQVEAILPGTPAIAAN